MDRTNEQKKWSPRKGTKVRDEVVQTRGSPKNTSQIVSIEDLVKNKFRFCACYFSFREFI